MVGRLRVRSLAGVGRTCPKPSGRSGSGLAPTRQTADALDVGAGAGAGVAPAGGEAVAGPAGTATEDGLGLALGCVDGWAAQAATNAPSTKAISRRTPRSMRSRVPRSARHGWQLVAHPGRRDELVALLMAGIRELKNADGCDLYVVSREVDDRNTIWVVEACRDDAAHCAALATPEVRAVIERGIPLIVEFDGVKLEPVGGVGLD
jgi:quinol monooxygenase YgiN